MDDQIRNPENATTPNARLNLRRKAADLSAHVSAARPETARGFLHVQARKISSRRKRAKMRNLFSMKNLASLPFQRSAPIQKSQKSRTARHPDAENSSFLIQKAVRAELSSNSGGYCYFQLRFHSPALSSFSAVSVGIRYTIPEEAGAAAVRVSSSGAGFPTRKT